MKTVNDIRREFLSFFEGKGHKIVPSSPLVPQNDPTLMFTNAGMVQFKDVFTGKEKREYKRAATAQKCVRAGGKHNDLENVGYTARHHTFFEMLGNFSFGDYFKDDAIAFAWELVTKNFALPPEKLLVTVHSSDEDAAAIWRKVTGFSDDKIIRIPTSDNFWAMGDTGPCGPCTEIFYDHGADIPGGPPGSPDEDGDRFVEIWNNVFMQFEQVDADTRIDLPAPSVDTGMGLERIAAIMQGKHNNYDIDLLRVIIEHSADLTQTDPGSASHKVIADHLRASAFLMADGVMPSNEGRGYVLRRIMRRGMRHAHLLGAQDPLLHRLVPTLIAQMGEAYPELRRAEAMVGATLKNEETRFKRTLEQGLRMLDDEAEKIPAGRRLSGEIAFKLYDTYGFPVDLTQDALKEKGIAVDMDGFDAAMEKQRAQARAAWTGSGDTATEKLWFDLLEQHGPTEFLGYTSEEAEGQALALIRDGKIVNSAEEGDQLLLLANQTPFYGESGGQVGDRGVILTSRGSKLEVTDTQKKVGALSVHVCDLVSGKVETGDALVLKVDDDRRRNIRAHHSVTHLLHKALKDVLGAHVAQKGSLQDDERTRFDISHGDPITPEQARRIEEIVNRQIRANTKVETRLMPVDEAIESGAEALFGEKYDDEVRVLSMGTEDEKTGRPFSVELCGGTHVSRTGDIGLFKIVGQGAVSAGVRRVEGVAGKAAFDYLARNEDLLGEAVHILKTAPADLPARIRTLMEDRKKLESEIAALRKQIATGGAGGGSNDDVRDVGGVKFIARVLPGIPARDLKGMVDELKKKLGSGVVALIATDEGKASIVVGVTDDLTDKISAVDLVKTGAQALGGTGGGGRPDMAQAGGPNADAANDALSGIEQTIKR